jgi:hypothetical protein
LRDNRLNQQKYVHFLRKRLFLSVQTGKIRPRQRQGMARTEADELKWNKKQKTAWTPRPQRRKGKAQQSRDRKPLRHFVPPPLARGGICSERCFAVLKPPLARGGAEAFAEAERFLNRERYARPTSTEKGIFSSRH